MKIAILSDFHLGYERFREDAYRQADIALTKASQMADVMLIPGDIFDNRTPKPDVIAEAIKIFSKASKKEWGAKIIKFIGEGQHYTDIPIIAIPGTHERRAQDAIDPVDILGMIGLVVDVSDATAVVEKDGERVAVVGIGGIADERFREVVVAADPKPVKDAFSIFMFHESVYELLPFSPSFIKQEELPEGFDLYVCGHIHSRVDSQVHGKKFIIPGSTVLTQLKAGEQESKGFYVYDTKSGKYEFVTIESRRFVVVNVKLGTGEDVDFVEREIEKAVGKADDMPIVRVVLEGRLDNGSGVEMELSALPKKYQSRAIVEVARSGIDTDAIKDANSGISSNALENVPIKEYGMNVLAGKLKGTGASFGKISAVELFEMLSSDGTKDKIINAVMNSLLEN